MVSQRNTGISNRMDIYNDFTVLITVVIPLTSDAYLTIHTILAALEDSIDCIVLQRFLNGLLDILELFTVQIQVAEHIGRIQVNCFRERRRYKNYTQCAADRNQQSFVHLFPPQDILYGCKQSVIALQNRPAVKLMGKVIVITVKISYEEYIFPAPTFMPLLNLFDHKDCIARVVNQRMRIDRFPIHLPVSRPDIKLESPRILLKND